MQYKTYNFTNYLIYFVCNQMKGAVYINAKTARPSFLVSGLYKKILSIVIAITVLAAPASCWFGAAPFTASGAVPFAVSSAASFAAAGESDADADREAEANGNADISANNGVNTDVDVDVDANADTDANINANADADTNTDANADANADNGVESSADSVGVDRASSATAPDLTPADQSPSITNSPSFRQSIAVNAEENDVSVHPEVSPESMFDISDMPDFDADAYILIDRRTGQTICSKNADKMLYPASTTKIMTAILAIEMGDMNELMTASVRAVRDIGPDGSNIGIIAGEQIRLDNLLDALLVRSANETANIIAENIGETREDFIDLMNERARELGALNTHFANASGVHDTNHYSTAYDLAMIANYAMNNERFRKTVVKRSITLSPTNKHSSWDRLNNTNQLLFDDTIKGFTVTGVKTGFHSAAGYCVVASGIDNNNMELLCVVLGVRGAVAGTSARRFKIASDLLSYGFENYQMSTFIRDNELVGTISVLGGENIDTVDAMSDGTIRLFMPVEQHKWNISRIEYIKSEVHAPVENGDNIGYVEFRNGGRYAGRVNLIASSDVAAIKGGVREIPNRGDTGSAWSAISIADGTGSSRLWAGDGSASSEAPVPGNSTGAGRRSLLSFGGNVDGAAAAGGGNSSPLSRIDTGGVLKIALLVVLALAVFISVLRTINTIRRSKKRSDWKKYHGRLEYPPMRSRQGRVNNRRYGARGGRDGVRGGHVGANGRREIANGGRYSASGRAAYRASDAMRRRGSPAPERASEKKYSYSNQY